MEVLESYRDANGDLIELKQYGEDTFYHYKNGLLHREDDLPAIEGPNGYKEWYMNGKLHREKGKAFECVLEFDYEWYYKGIGVPCNTQEEFERLIRLSLFW